MTDTFSAEPMKYLSLFEWCVRRPNTQWPKSISCGFRVNQACNRAIKLACFLSKPNLPADSTLKHNTSEIVHKKSNYIIRIVWGKCRSTVEQTRAADVTQTSKRIWLWRFCKSIKKTHYYFSFVESNACELTCLNKKHKTECIHLPS